MGVQHGGQVYDCLGLPCHKGCLGYHCQGIQHHILGIGVAGVQKVGWPEACCCQCHHHHHPLLHLCPQRYLSYQHSRWCVENQVRMVRDQGWVWGGVGDIDVGGMLAWAGGPVRYHGQFSVGLCDNKTCQGLNEEKCQDW